MIDINSHILPYQASILEVLEAINVLPKTQTVFLVDESKKLKATVTDGDVRRGLLSNHKLSDRALEIANKEFKFLDSNNPEPHKIHALKKLGVKLIPILNKDGQIERLLDLSVLKALLPIDAVIMAGGRGERLRPLTDSLPKPMLPLGSKPIIEHNIDHLIQYGVSNLFISVKYLGDKITDYFGNGSAKSVYIRYINEDIPLGTIGAVKKIDAFSNDTILVMNSDLFTDFDLEEFYLHFINSNSDLCVASIPYSVSIPYAVMNIEQDQVTAFEEKPTYTYYSNAGIYLIKKNCIDLIPSDKQFHATDLMQKLIDSGKKVSYFPLMGYWIDIGKPEDYKKAQEFIKFLK